MKDFIIFKSKFSLKTCDLYLKYVLLLVVNLYYISFSSRAQNITRPNIEGPSNLQVNSYTGSLFYQRTDMFIPGRGLSMDITFTYNSADRSTDWGYGYGWTFNYNQFYIITDSSIIFYNKDGRQDHFQRSGTNYISPIGVFDSVTNYAVGKFIIKTKNGMLYNFDDSTHKKLTSITDRNGNKLTLTYSGKDLVSIKDASNRTFLLTWTTNRLTEIKADFGGTAKTVKYTYDPAGTLISVKDPMGNNYFYSYARGKLMSKLTDRNGNITDIIYNINNAVVKLVSCESEKTISYNTQELKTYVSDKNNEKTNTTTYSFNKEGNLDNKSGNCCGYNTSYSYDEENNINQVTDANGKVYTFSYDTRGNLISETDPLGQTISYAYENEYNNIISVTDKGGNKTEYLYDNKGNLTQLREPLSVTTTYSYEANGDRKSLTDPRGNRTLFTYSKDGYLATVTDADGGVTTLTHDGWGNRLSQKDANNNTSSFVYDALNRVTSSTDALNNRTSYTYDANGNMLSITDAKNNKTSYVYNSRDQVVIVTDAANNPSVMEYDALGNMIVSSDANGYRTTYNYDKLSRRETETNPLGEVVYYSYDGNGNTIRISYPNGNAVDIRYDGLNRAVSITDRLGIIKNYQYDANDNKISEADSKGNTISYQYDALNRLTVKTDPLGNVYTYTYDANNNITSEKDRNGNSTFYQYNLLSRLTKITDAGGFNTTMNYDAVGNQLSVTDAKGNITSYSYDALNRNTQEIFADNTTKAYTYDEAGNLLTRKDNKGQITTFSYDKLYRPIVKSYPGGVDNFEYDASGILTMATNSSATVVLSYDKAYRIISETLNGKTTAYKYNVSAGIKHIIYPGGRKIERKLDERNQLKVINEGPVTLASFEYNNSGENTGRRYGNGSTTSIQYNANKQVVSISTNPSNIIDFNYNYDKEGNPLSTEFKHKPQNSEQYIYDSKNQLIQFQKGSYQQSIYNYDGVGNRINTQVNGVTTNYSTNSLNEYQSISQANIVSNNFDPNGNLISEGMRNLDFDIENRLISVNNGAIAKYTYDALGRRIKKITGFGDSISFYYAGLQVIEERDQFDSIKVSYTWGTWLDDIVSMNKKSIEYYYHTNIIGSVIAITNNVGSVVERYEYDVFGKVTLFNEDYIPIMQSGLGNNYTFSGRELDKETNYYFYRTRHYNSSNGHFIERDPLEFVDGFNLYSYVKGNPLKFIDPYGTRAVCPYVKSSKSIEEYQEEAYKRAYDQIKKLGNSNFTKEELENLYTGLAFKNLAELRENDVSNTKLAAAEHYSYTRNFATENKVISIALIPLITLYEGAKFAVYAINKPMILSVDKINAPSRPSWEALKESYKGFYEGLFNIPQKRLSIEEMERKDFNEMQIRFPIKG